MSEAFVMKVWGQGTPERDPECARAVTHRAKPPGKSDFPGFGNVRIASKLPCLCSQINPENPPDPLIFSHHSRPEVCWGAVLCLGRGESERGG